MNYKQHLSWLGEIRSNKCRSNCFRQTAGAGDDLVLWLAEIGSNELARHKLEQHQAGAV